MLLLSRRNFNEQEKQSIIHWRNVQTYRSRDKDTAVQFPYKNFGDTQLALIAEIVDWWKYKR